jgi:hypothetical protein
MNPNNPTEGHHKMTRLETDLAPGIAAHETYDTAQSQRITDLEAALAECEAGQPPVDPGTGKTWIVGMKTENDEWDTRVEGLLPAPTNGRRLFKSSWDVPGMVKIAEQCHNGGHFPYISAKMSPSTWQQVAAGALDTQARDLAQRLVALGYPIRVTFHHEPRGGNVDTPQELVPWADALTRLFTQMRQAVSDTDEKRLILGPCDNGHPWGQEWGTQTDAQLNTYYKQSLLDVCDVMGADFYDGATDTNDGEPAWIKMDYFAQYMDRRGFVGVNDPGWKYDAGEWNFVKASDCDDTLEFLVSEAGKDFNCLNLFNSAENNRDDLPTELNGSWELVPGTDRHDAYQAFCTALAGDTRSPNSTAQFHARPRRLPADERFGDRDWRDRI